MAPVTVFVDTQTLLHYQWLDQIDWCSLLATDRVDVILALVVIQELDKHKRDPQKKRRGRARDRFTQIARALGESGPLRTGVTLRSEHGESLADLVGRGLDPEVNDDRLIGSVIAFAKANPGARVVLCADDYGLRLKAPHFDVEILSLPDDYELEDEPDPLEAKVKELERKVRLHENRSPKLRVAFKDWKEHIRIELFPPIALTESDIAARVETAGIKECPPYRPPVMPSIRDLRSISLATIGLVPSGDEIKRYGTERETFLEAIRDYWTKWPEFENRRRLTAELELFVVNDGTAPAKEILLYLHIPDGVDVVDEAPKGLKKPVPPVWPRPFHEALRMSMPNFSLPNIRAPEIGPPENVSRPTIQRTKSFTVSFEIGKVIQKRRERLDTLYVVFDGFDTARSFAIDYRISSESVPEIVEGQVNVAIEKGGAIPADGAS